MKNYFKIAFRGFFAIFVYLILNNYQALPFKLLNIDVNTLPMYVKILYSLIYEILIVCVLILIYNKQFISDFKDLKINHKKYFSESIKYWLIGLIIMYISNFIIIYGFNNGLGDNEETIRSLFTISPVYIYISSVIIAPVTEELVFRQSLKNIFQNKYLFIIMTGVLFGFAHIGFNFSSLSDLLYIIPYGALGSMFGIMLEKTNNIFVSMGFHLMHNGILVGIQFLLLIFG